MAKRWRCLICGYIHVGEKPPYVCPVCQAPQKMFELMDDAPDTDTTGKQAEGDGK